MAIFDTLTHYVALNPVPHCNVYYEYPTLYEDWIAKFGLTEILVTNNNEIIHYVIYVTLNTKHEHLMPLGLMV